MRSFTVWRDGGTVPRLWHVVAVALWCLRLASAYSKTFVMKEYCDDLIDMEDRSLTSLTLRLTDNGVYRPHMSCTSAVRAPRGHRLTMVTEWMDVAVGRFGFCSDYLSVWDGDFGNVTGYVQGMKPKVCGQAAPPPVSSVGRALKLHFDSNTLEDGAGFSLIFTAFHEGSCKRGEFTCDNGRCIDERLKCDGDNNCGDNSDGCLLGVGMVVVAVVVTSIIFFLILGAALLYCHRDRLKWRKKCPIIGANPDGVYQPTTEPVTATSSQTSSTTATTAV